VTTGASIGLVCSHLSLATSDDYLRAADAAMYEAKSLPSGLSVFSVGM